MNRRDELMKRKQGRKDVSMEKIKEGRKEGRKDRWKIRGKEMTRKVEKMDQSKKERNDGR
ncbi:MAG: hypothetical protein ACRCTS_06320 [Fusobacteriaceae bacterium]